MFRQDCVTATLDIQKSCAGRDSSILLRSWPGMSHTSASWPLECNWEALVALTKVHYFTHQEFKRCEKDSVLWAFCWIDSTKLELCLNDVTADSRNRMKSEVHMANSLHRFKTDWIDHHSANDPKILQKQIKSFSKKIFFNGQVGHLRSPQSCLY